MRDNTYLVTVAAGSLRSARPAAISMPHRWTSEGVTVEADFTGAHLLHLAVAGCVLNDLYREAEALGLSLAGVRVYARGSFDAGTWRSTGIAYEVDLEAPSATPAQVAELLDAVDAVAEIPRALRQGAPVVRSG